MSPENFRAATDRIKRERNLGYGAQAEAIGISRSYMTDCRRGRESPSRTIIMALRSLACDAPPLPEEEAGKP